MRVRFPGRAEPFRSGLLILALVLAAGCGVRAGSFTNPLESRLILQVPYFDDSRGSYGPAALASVMTYNGFAITPDETVRHLGEKPPLPQALVVLARQSELKADLFIGAPEQLIEAVKNNQPAIVRLDLPLPPLLTGDFAVVVGYTPDGIVVNSRGVNQRIIPWADFLAAWHQAKNVTVMVEPIWVSP